MNEEIVFGMGMDNTPFAKALRGAREIAKDAVTDIKNTFTNGLRNLFEPLLGAFAVRELYESVKGVMEWGKQIKLAAEEAGVTTDFIQGLDSAAHKLGISGDTASSSMAILSRKVGEARTQGGEAAKVFERWGIALNGMSNEQVFYQIADKMKEIQDPAQRSAMAFDLMGRGAKEMAAALPVGADAIKAMIESASKLGEAELDKLDEIDGKLEEIGRKWHVLWGGIVASFVESPTGALSTDAINKRAAELEAADRAKDKGRLFPSWTTAADFHDKAVAQLIDEGKAQAVKNSLTEAENTLIDKAIAMRDKADAKQLTTKEQIALYEAKGLEIQKQVISAQQKGQDVGKLLVDYEENRNNWLEANAKKTKEEADAKKKMAEDQKKADADARRERHAQQEIDHASLEVAKANDRLQDAKDKRSQLTLSDLTGSRYHFTGSLGNDQHLAFQIQRLENQGEWNRQRGFLGASKDRFNSADSLRAQLSTDVPESERFPFKSLQESAKEAAEHLGTIVDNCINDDGTGMSVYVEGINLDD